MEEKDDIQEEKVSEEEVKEENEVKEEVHEEEKDALENTQEVVRPAEPVKKKKNGLKLIVVLLVIILLCVIGYMAYANLLTGKKETIKTDNKEYKSEYRLSGNGLEDFDLYFMKLENNKKNAVYSPLSIKYAMEMLAEGADGDSKAQLDAVIGDYKAKKYPNNEHMSFANAMFIRDSFKDQVKESYIKNLQEKYGAEVQYADFNSASPMNDWVSNRTFKLINDLLNDDTVSKENFELINALAIDMNWINRIQHSAAPLPEGMNQKYYTVKYPHENYSDYINSIEGENYPAMNFNGVDNIKSVKVAASFNRYDIVKDKGEENIRKEVGDAYDKAGQPCGDKEYFVNRYIKDLDSNYNKADTSTDFYISDTEEYKIFAKDLQTYEGVTLQYVGIMPKKDDLDNYIENLNADDVSTAIRGMKEVKLKNFKEGVVTHIVGYIPLFKYEYKLDLIEDLNKLKIEDIFDINKADLSKMIKGKQFINSANHSANIEFSNDGIKAAAATSFGGAGSSGCDIEFSYDVPIEEIDVTFDKPYMYIIRDKDSGEVWFAGTVYEPLTK